MNVLERKSTKNNFVRDMFHDATYMNRLTVLREDLLAELCQGDHLHHHHHLHHYHCHHCHTHRHHVNADNRKCFMSALEKATTHDDQQLWTHLSAAIGGQVI